MPPTTTPPLPKLPYISTGIPPLGYRYDYSFVSQINHFESRILNLDWIYCKGLLGDAFAVKIDIVVVRGKNMVTSL